jgi:hypothetical protein
VKEEWRDIENYEGLYQVSNLGRVQSLTRTRANCLGHIHTYPGRILRPGLGVNWLYLTVSLHRDNVAKTHYVHYLVAAAFIGPRPKDADVRHGRGGSQDNRVTNLCYGTRTENHLDRYRDGTMKLRPVRRADGRVFPSLKAAAAAMGLSKDGSGIVAAIKGTRGTCLAGGYEWEYVNAKEQP